jgi:hypothetical protein
MILALPRSSKLHKTDVTPFALATLAATYSNAAAMRCGTNLIEPKDGQHDVAIKCGKRTVVEHNPRHYDRGPHTFIKSLFFTNGQLQTIENGEYGDRNRKRVPLSFMP